MNWELLWSALALSCDNGWESTLGDDGNSLPLVVDLWQISKDLGNLSNVLGLDAVALSVSKSLALVTNDNVPVWGRLVKRLLEKLWDEWCGKGDNEGLVVLSGLLSDSLDGLWADREVVTTDVDKLCVLNKLPDLWLLQVIHLVVVCGSKISAHRSVVTSDDNTATSGGVLLGDTVLGTKTGLLVGLLEDGGILVVSDAANVDNRVVWENVLSTTSSVLRSSTGDELSIKVIQKVLVEAKVLLLGEDSIVLLETILVKKSLVTSCLDVWFCTSI